ncbi:uncharacterized protein LOC121381753 [Gigantopelta aegis]|uniref:uncharacterized protein LOC121381753 n=1 Tax=Gigantopelta aegis TaxID=1735272 RepID=UPI001B887C72|nr:uncharacterized protein LOC121381753 [Gigantopelta aegis]
MLGYKYILCACIYVLAVRLASSDNCVKTGPCSCKSSNGTIDLSPLASTGKPKYMDLPDASNTWFYSWNPCTPFTEGTGNCDKVAVCQSDTASSFWSLGTQDSASFFMDVTKGLQLQYMAEQGDTTRTTFVTLICDTSQEGSVTFDGEVPVGSALFYFTLRSKYACAGGSGPDITVTVSISAGSIMCIIFFVLLFVYFSSGVSYQTFVRKASGREMIPNSGLWCSLPGLIRDGVLFVIRCGKTGTYDKI